MRISDWSSDVCSSDLGHDRDAIVLFHHGIIDRIGRRLREFDGVGIERVAIAHSGGERPVGGLEDRAAMGEHRVAHPRGAEQEDAGVRSEEHTSELTSLMRNSYDFFCLKKKNITTE